MRIEVAKPCYFWRRSREATRVTVYDVSKDEVVEEYYPYSMYQGLQWRSNQKEENNNYRIYDPRKHVVFYRYRTKSNTGKIILYHHTP